MLRFKSRYIAFIITLSSIIAQQNQAIDIWRNILQTPYIVDYFDGVISKVGVIIKDTNESLTLEHTGQNILFYPGISSDVVFSVQIKMENVNNMVSHASDGEINYEESWKIINVLFTPMFESTFKMAMDDPIRIKLANLDDVTHCYFFDKDGKEKIFKHSIIYNDNEIKILKKLVGVPKRVYYLNTDQALSFQKKMQKAIIKDSIFEWISFANWHRKWRNNNSKLVEN
tara:strand:- start:444 stop:1127 length:684 start_codon:yes stop_codon:yes gene_type:complete